MLESKSQKQRQFLRALQGAKYKNFQEKIQFMSTSFFTKNIGRNLNVQFVQIETFQLSNRNKKVLLKGKQQSQKDIKQNKFENYLQDQIPLVKKKAVIIITPK